MGGRLALVRALQGVPPRLLVVIVLLNGVLAVLPAAGAWASGLVVARAGPLAGGWSVIAALMLFGFVLAASETLGHALDLANTHAARAVDGRIRSEVRRSLAALPTLDLAEDPAMLDDIALATSTGGARGMEQSIGTGAYGQVAMAFRTVGSVVTAAVLVPLSPLLAVAALALTWWSRTWQSRQWLRLADVDARTARGQRQTAYWSELGAGAAAAKEVRVFGLSDWIAGRRRRQALGYLQPRWRGRVVVLRRQVWPALIGLVCGLLVLAVPSWAAARGAIGASELARYVVAGLALMSSIGFGHYMFSVAHARVAVAAHERVRSRFAAAGAACDSPGHPGTTRVELRGVVFSYHEQPVLRGLDLTMQPGEVVAVVGRNGAGKTTLVKVLAGLYMPTRGVVAAPGRDQIAVLFQDFVRYPLSLRDNVTLAAPGFDDTPGVDSALALAGGADLAGRLPNGLDTVLSTAVPGGVDLSGGQWQKVALARIVYAARHGRWLLIMDEPTAHLDAEQEAAFYERVVRTLAGATIVLISHRLSTVRSADRILLLEEGRIVEQGSHDALIARGGEYARMFRLQADRFAAVDG